MHRSPSAAVIRSRALHFVRNASGLLSLAIGFGIAGPSCSAADSLDEEAEHTAVSVSELSGAKPFAVLRCKYPDDPTDFINNEDYADRMLTVGNFWSEVSYNNVNLAGTQVFPQCTTTGCSRYYPLPRPKAEYWTEGTRADGNLLANDCMALADAEVDFSRYYGVVIFPNGGFDSNWGTPGNTYEMNPPRDGVSQLGVAWLPTWDDIGKMAHEIGHTFGLPHVMPAAPAGEDWFRGDVMAYGTLGNTNVHHKDLLGWIPAARKYLVTSGGPKQIELERTAQPPLAAGKYLMAEVPGIAGTRFVIEARRRAGSDGVLDAEGVFVYNVITPDPYFQGSAFVVDPEANDRVNEASSILVPGESYSESSRGFSISVDAQTTTGYRVTLNYAPPACSGNGFAAKYYNNMDFTSLAKSRTDQHLSFDWKDGSPDPAIAADTFSARWDGQVTAPVTGKYKFYAQVDDGVRLWVNNVLLIDQWNAGQYDEFSGTINLTQGQKYDVRMEYFEDGGPANVRLFWSAPGLSKSSLGCAVSSSTPDRTEGGTATGTGASCNTTTETPSKAYDNLMASGNFTKWCVTSAPTTTIPISTMYDFSGTTAFAINKYTLTTANDVPARDPKNWTFQGCQGTCSVSSDAGWVTLDTRTNQFAGAARFQTNTYSFNNNTAYQQYRLRVTANNGATTRFQIAELQMFAANTCSAETDAQFCARSSKNCGTLTGTDNCGAPRTVTSCGSCTSPQTCGGGGTPNVCGGGTTQICAAPYAQANCTGYLQGTVVSSGGRNWLCSNGNCANCASFAECAPGGSGCPWGVVWTDQGLCQ